MGHRASLARPEGGRLWADRGPPGVVRPMDVERREGCREHAWAAVVQPFSCTYPSELRWREAASLTFVNRLTHL